MQISKYLFIEPIRFKVKVVIKMFRFQDYKVILHTQIHKPQKHPGYFLMIILMKCMFRDQLLMDILLSLILICSFIVNKENESETKLKRESQTVYNSKNYNIHRDLSHFISRSRANPMALAAIDGNY